MSEISLIGEAQVRARPAHELFQRQAEARPEAVALEFDGRTMSYGELAARSARLARLLRARGVRRETAVAVCMDRCFGLIVAQLAVLEAGAAYLPLDPGDPAARLSFALDTAGVELVLSRRRERARMSVGLDAAGARAWIEIDDPHIQVELEAMDPTLPAHDSRPGDLAYVIFTSGSTGRPKGVLLEHGGLANLAGAQQSLFAVGPDDRVLQFASPGFDAATWEWVMALCAGARLCLLPAVVARSPQLGPWMHTRGITHATLPPAVLPSLEPQALPKLRTLILAGEACPASLVERWSQGRELWNAYGPSETTVCATAGRYDPDTPGFSIGRAIPGVEVQLLDTTLEPVASGEVGEICIAGAALARGYIGDELNEGRFVVADVRGRRLRLYRSGDLGRRRSDGALEFLGRSDRQVKLRGVRIELDEVEAVLASHPTVAQAAVLVRGRGPGDARLVAFVRPWGEGDELDEAELRAHLAERLPESMRPAELRRLTTLPLTSRGKVDYAALTKIEGERLELCISRSASTAVERVICMLFAELLEVPRVGAAANFFTLGGNSLLAAELTRRLSETYALCLPPTLIFEMPTVHDLAGAVELLADIRAEQERST